MTRVWHIVRKDVRSHRLLLLAWIILIAINIATRLIGPYLYDENLGQRLFREYLFTVSLASLVVPALLIANMIHSDGLIGTTAFWLTRPIARGTMLQAKLLGAFLMVLTPALAGEAILMAAFRVSPTTIVVASLELGGILALGILVITLAAAVTPNLPRLVMLLIGGGVAFQLWTSIRLVGVRYHEANPPQRFMDPTVGIIVFSLIAASALIALIWQYRQRRPAAAVAIFVASVILNVETAGFWNRMSLFGGEPTVAHEPWSNGPLTVHPGEPLTSRMLEGSAVMLDIGPRRLIVAPLTIDGLPAGFATTTFTMTAHVEFADGSIAWSDPTNSWERRQPVNQRDWQDQQWPVLMHGWDAALRKADDQPGHYTAMFDIGVVRHETLASLPMAVGAGYTDGARGLSITAFHRVDDYCIVDFEKTAVRLVTDGLSSPDLMPTFRLRDGTPLWNPRLADTERASPRGSANYDVLPPHPFRVDLTEAAVIYATQDARNSGPPCEDIVVDIERVRYAGHLTRTLDLPDLRLNVARVEDRPR